jgi:WD40 repeat protein
MIYIWDARSGDLRAEIRAHAGEVGILCFSPAGSGILASYGADNILRIWDADSGTNIRTLTGFEKRVSNLDFSEDGSLLYIIENRELLLIYDMEGGKITGVQEYVDPDALLQRELRAKRGYLEFVDGMAFSPDGRILATGSYYSKPTLFWDVKTGEIVSTMDVRAVQIEYSHDGSLLATRDLDGGVSIWRTGDGVKIFATNVGSAEDILFSPDGRYLAVGSYGQILLLDVARQEIIRRINAQGERVNHLSFARDDGVLAAVVEPDVIVKYWDVSTGAVLWEFTPPDIDYSSRAVDLDNDVLSLFRAADVENNIVELWNTRTKTRIQQFTDIDDYLNILIGFNSDQTIAVVSFRYGIAFFDVATGIPLQRLDLRLGYSSLAFSPDSSLLAIGDFTGGIRLWDVRGLTGNA